MRYDFSTRQAISNKAHLMGISRVRTLLTLWPARLQFDLLCQAELRLLGNDVTRGVEHGVVNRYCWLLKFFLKIFKNKSDTGKKIVKKIYQDERDQVSSIYLTEA